MNRAFWLCMVVFAAANAAADSFRMGFEEFASGATATDLTGGVDSHFCCDGDEYAIVQDVSQGSTYGGAYGFPLGFSSLGNRMLSIETGTHVVNIGVTTNENGWIGSGVVQSADESIAFDIMAVVTGFEEPQTLIPTMAKPSKALASTSLLQGRNFIIPRPIYILYSGFAVAVDEDILVYPTEFWDEYDTVATTNWYVLAGERSVGGGSVSSKNFKLVPTDGGTMPEPLSGWHRLTLERKIDGGDVVYGIRIDGRLMCAADDAGGVTALTNFQALVSSPTDPVRALRFYGIGSVDDVSIYSAFALQGGVQALDCGGGTWQINGSGSLTDLSSMRDKGVTNLVIGSGITSVGENVFSGWRSLRDVTVGADCTALGANAFSKCYNLTNVTCAAMGLSLGDYAFLRCNALQSLSFAAEPTCGEMPFAFHAEIYMRDGMPEVVARPQLSIGGLTQVLLGKTNLTDAAWCEVKDEQTRAGCHFFKFEMR